MTFTTGTSLRYYNRAEVYRVYLPELEIPRRTLNEKMARHRLNWSLAVEDREESVDKLRADC